MNVWGSFVDLIDEDTFLTLKNAVFCLDQDDSKSLDTDPKFGSVIETPSSQVKIHRI